MRAGLRSGALPPTSVSDRGFREQIVDVDVHPSAIGNHHAVITPHLGRVCDRVRLSQPTTPRYPTTARKTSPYSGPLPNGLLPWFFRPAEHRRPSGPAVVSSTCIHCCPFSFIRSAIRAKISVSNSIQMRMIVSYSVENVSYRMEMLVEPTLPERRPSPATSVTFLRTGLYHAPNLYQRFSTCSDNR